jgi:hypothetical protein
MAPGKAQAALPARGGSSGSRIGEPAPVGLSGFKVGHGDARQLRSDLRLVVHLKLPSLSSSG